MRAKKSKRKGAIAERRAMPEIYVKLPTMNSWRQPAFVKAKIRLKAGEYQYLQWRDGETVRSLYLGRKRKS